MDHALFFRKLFLCVFVCLNRVVYSTMCYNVPKATCAQNTCVNQGICAQNTAPCSTTEYNTNTICPQPEGYGGYEGMYYATVCNVFFLYIHQSSVHREIINQNWELKSVCFEIIFYREMSELFCSYKNIYNFF